MAKAKKSIYFCQNCGHEESKWLGQCPMCREWNTFVEEKVTVSKGTAAKNTVREAEVVTLSSVSTDQEDRMQTEIEDLDRVLGGGVVPGSLVLVGGDPGSQPCCCRCVSGYQIRDERCFTFPVRSH